MRQNKVIFVKILEAAVLTVIAALLAGIGVTAISMAFGVPFTGASNQRNSCQFGYSGG